MLSKGFTCISQRGSHLCCKELTGLVTAYQHYLMSLTMIFVQHLRGDSFIFCSYPTMAVQDEHLCFTGVEVRQRQMKWFEMWSEGEYRKKWLRSCFNNW